LDILPSEAMHLYTLKCSKIQIGYLNIKKYKNTHESDIIFCSLCNFNIPKTHLWELNKKDPERRYTFVLM